MICLLCEGTGYRQLSTGHAPCEACVVGQKIAEMRRKRLERRNKRKGITVTAQKLAKALDVVRHFQDREES